MKTCTGCKQTKNYEDFYKHSNPSNGDGYRSKCKECYRDKQCSYRANNKDKIKAYNKKYEEENKEKIKAYRKRYHQQNYVYAVFMTEEEKKTKKRERDLKAWAEYPEKRKARNAVANIKVEKGFSKHHWSYNREHFKDVIVLDNTIHRTIHKSLVYCKASFFFKTLNGELLDTKEKHLNYINSL